jgi:acetyltransferase-like isoleucine patch superfamily enzyme
MNLPDGLVINLNNVVLDDRSTFELPVVIQCTFSNLHEIHVGCFTGIYGGKIGHCTIGRYCSIAPAVDIASDQHPTDWLSSSMVQYVDNIHGWGDWIKRNGDNYYPPVNKFHSNEPVTIGNDVWVGQGVFIKSGVKIGDGAVIAAHSVVTKDVPSFAIVAGVPATVKKYRFDEDTIERIKQIEWWNYNISGIKSISFNNISSSLDLLSKLIDDKKLVCIRPKTICYSDIKNKTLST